MHSSRIGFFEEGRGKLYFHVFHVEFMASYSRVEFVLFENIDSFLFFTRVYVRTKFINLA